MHITMVKKRLRDGSECRKCAEATQFLQARGVWDRIDAVVWAVEDRLDSPGMVLAARLGVDRAPFFLVREDAGERVYTSVVQLVRERLGHDVPAHAVARQIDPDDIGGI